MNNDYDRLVAKVEAEYLNARKSLASSARPFVRNKDKYYKTFEDHINRESNGSLDIYGAFDSCAEIVKSINYFNKQCEVASNALDIVTSKEFKARFEKGGIEATNSFLNGICGVYYSRYNDIAKDLESKIDYYACPNGQYINHSVKPQLDFLWRNHESLRTMVESVNLIRCLAK